MTETYTEREREREEALRREGKKEWVTDRRKKKAESAPQREDEQRNTRTKSMWSQYTVNIQYVSHHNLLSPQCHLFSSLEVQLKPSCKCSSSLRMVEHSQHPGDVLC